MKIATMWVAGVMALVAAESVRGDVMLYNEGFGDYAVSQALADQNSAWVRVPDVAEIGWIREYASEGKMYRMRRFNGYSSLLREDVAKVADVSTSARVMFDDTKSSYSADWGLYARHDGAGSYVRARLDAGRDSAANQMWFNLILETDTGTLASFNKAMTVTVSNGMYHLDGTLQLDVVGDTATAVFNGKTVTAPLPTAYLAGGYTGFYIGNAYQSDYAWGLYMDDVTATAVPEPAGLAIAGVGVVLLLRRR